ncbi:MAG TPA: hypothetical protein VIP09_04075 [Dehalococcoidia bacterium]|jgi:hypothetical protein
MSDPKTYQDRDLVAAANQAWADSMKRHRVTQMPGEIVLPMRVFGLLFGFGAVIGTGVDMGGDVIRDRILYHTREAKPIRASAPNKPPRRPRYAILRSGGPARPAHGLALRAGLAGRGVNAAPPSRRAAPRVGLTSTPALADRDQHVGAPVPVQRPRQAMPDQHGIPRQVDAERPRPRRRTSSFILVKHGR